MLARGGTARAVTSLDHQDLRGWHYVLTGGVLGSISPYGFDAGMTGRWAYVNDSLGGCAAALQRLRLILGAAGTPPESVALLPVRSSRILGSAAAATLGLPATDFNGLLAQTVVPPWAAQLGRLEDGTVGKGPADERPAEAVADEIAGATPDRDEGDGSTPADSDEGLRRFVAAVAAAGTGERDGG
jgi:hypothetical protein